MSAAPDPEPEADEAAGTRHLEAVSNPEPMKQVQLSLLSRVKTDQFRVGFGGSVNLSLEEGGKEALLAKALKFGEDVVVTLAPASNPDAFIEFDGAITVISMSRQRHSQAGDSNIAKAKVAIQAVSDTSE